MTPTLTRTYAYDGDGNQTSLTDPLGQITTFTYDALNRLTGLSFSDGQTPNVAYAYDADGARTSMQDGTGATTYATDELGRLTSVASPGNVTVGYRYDLDGNRTKLIYPDGTAVVSTYDKASRLASLADWANRTTSYGYFPDGHLKTVTNVDGTTATYSEDNAQRLTQVLNQQGTTTIDQHTYTLDAVGNRTQRQETLAQVGGGQSVTTTTSYSYDKLYRLTGDGTNSYAYDPVGNRVTLTQGGAQTAYSYDRADRITAAGATAYTVNANGDVTARGSDSFAYDQADRLKSATVAGATTTYAYDGDGNRASETVGGATTSYVYDRAGALPVVLSDGSRKYIYGVGLAYSVDGAGNVQVYHTDALGSVRALTDGSGNLIQTYKTDAFGVPTATQGTSSQPFGYTGQQQDGNGLVYLRARYYDPTTGRFLSRDAVGGDGTNLTALNRYAYAQDNPALVTDPSGRCPFCAIPVAAAACAADPACAMLVAFGTAELVHWLQQHPIQVPQISLPSASGAAASAPSPSQTPGPGGGSPVVSIDPTTIRFSQSSVNDAGGVIESMRANGWVGDPIDVVRMPDGALTTIDNTRLLAAREAGIEARVVIHDFNDPLPAE